MSTRMAARRLLSGILAVAGTCLPGMRVDAARPVDVVVPANLLHDFAPPPLPEAPRDAEGKARLLLGQSLFFEPLLSRSRSLSCATCHNPGLSWSNGLPRAIGDDANVMALRSPTLIDVAAIDRFGWDGKFPTMESVTFSAITGHANMDLPAPVALDRLRQNAGYVALFQQAFPRDGISEASVAGAIAAFERTIRSGPAPFDSFVAGDGSAISPAAKRGFLLFTGKAGCVQCHSGWAFTDGSFHDIGSATGEDVGRGRLFPTSKRLRYAFKVPTLRDVARRAPYMHDGSVPDLPSAIALYDRGGIARPSRDVLIRPLGLGSGEKSDLLAFLNTLTASPAPVAMPVLPR